MGPIMQERTASTTLKRVVSKEKIRVKNTENSGPVASSKKGNKTKKVVSPVKNGLPGPGQDKDSAALHRCHSAAAETGDSSSSFSSFPSSALFRRRKKRLCDTTQTPLHTASRLLQRANSTHAEHRRPTVTGPKQGALSKSGRLKSSAARNTSKVSSPEEEGDLRPQLRKHSSSHRKEEKQESQWMSQCSSEHLQNRPGLGKNRRALSLPLSPISGLRHLPAQALTCSSTPTPEAIQHHYNHKEEDSDSASDLSDSERLPVLPSPCTPCTPPHLNLRAEIINTNDFLPDFPGPHGAVGDEDESEKSNYNYPDFLPPPFNSWSLRQLAVFLHTEGRGAPPRPKPVGPLEKYLERLLQLEWLQIQTVQAEISRPPGSRTRQQGFPSQTTARPHTAPSSRLNSPKGRRHSSRAFPFTPVNNPPSPASVQHQLSHFPACPHCHIRYPLCNGSCSAYAYQCHSRLSPLLERKVQPGAGAKRSSSETRANSIEGRSPAAQGGGGGGGGARTPVSPSARKSHLRHMQASGNARRQPQEMGTNQNIKIQVRKSQVRAHSETDVKKESGGIKTPSAEKRGFAGIKKEIVTSKREEKNCQRIEAGGQTSKPAMKRAAKDPASHCKASPSSHSVLKQNSKTKNVHFVAK